MADRGRASLDLFRPSGTSGLGEDSLAASLADPEAPAPVNKPMTRDELATLLANISQGALFNHADDLVGIAGGIGNLFGDGGFSKGFHDVADPAVEREEELSAAHPDLANLGQTAGAGLSMLMPGLNLANAGRAANAGSRALQALKGFNKGALTGAGFSALAGEGAGEGLQGKIEGALDPRNLAVGGLLGGALGAFGRMFAKGSPEEKSFALNNLGKATELEKAGQDPSMIQKLTGWVRNPDNGKWLWGAAATGAVAGASYNSDEGLGSLANPMAALPLVGMIAGKGGRLPRQSLVPNIPGVTVRKVRGGYEVSPDDSWGMSAGWHDTNTHRVGSLEEAKIKAAELSGDIQYAEKAALPQMSVDRPSIKAYHGSPYDFDAFDMSKIGTGEGAQVYGHGLYFAENPEVAAGYRKRLAPGTPDGVKPDAKAIEKHQSEWDAAVVERRAQAGADGRGDTSAADAKMDDIHSRMVADTMERNPHLTGRQYEVSINADPEHFLDWDKPLSEQPELLKKLSASKRKAVREVLSSPMFADVTKRMQSYGRDLGPVTGEQLLKSISVALDGKTIGNKAAQALRAAGIKGIRYKDAGSRGAEGGTHNYVVFDDKIIDILKKYGIAGLGTGGLAAALAGEQGDGTSEIGTLP